MFKFETEQKICEIGGVRFGGQPKIQDRYPVRFGDHDLSKLEIAMDNTPAVGRADCPADRSGDLDCPGKSQRFFHQDDGLEGSPLDVFHFQNYITIACNIIHVKLLNIETIDRIHPIDRSAKVITVKFSYVLVVNIKYYQTGGAGLSAPCKLVPPWEYFWQLKFNAVYFIIHIACAGKINPEGLFTIMSLAP